MWLDLMVQICVVYLIWVVMWFVVYQDCKKVVVVLKLIYIVFNEEIVRKVLVEFEVFEFGMKYLFVVVIWVNFWEWFILFLQFLFMFCKVIYMINSIELLNFQLWKVIKNCGYFFLIEVVVKLFWLVICNIEDKCVVECVWDWGKFVGQCKVQGWFVEGQVVMNWKQVFVQFVVVYFDWINFYL